MSASDILYNYLDKDVLTIIKDYTNENTNKASIISNYKEVMEELYLTFYPRPVKEEYHEESIWVANYYVF